MALVLYLGKISSFTEMTHIIENVLNSVYKCVLVEVIVQNLLSTSSSMALAALLSPSQDCLDSIMDLRSSWFVKTFNK